MRQNCGQKNRNGKTTMDFFFTMFSTSGGLHFYEHAPIPCPCLDKPIGNMFIGFIQATSKPWPPITRLIQHNLEYLFPLFH